MWLEARHARSLVDEVLDRREHGRSVLRRQYEPIEDPALPVQVLVRRFGRLGKSQSPRVRRARAEVRSAVQNEDRLHRDRARPRA